ncbi:MAG: hypothetical protein KKA73_22335 [Chloroflexi bacterium]|nr:hypothetical protein [Chloroflexota bacterium]MBU1750432.1 hypothetical protein [Chloroflexota bacterium]
MDIVDSTWLAADYHLPALYSCRVPMSSSDSALALPGPGPATVRLALVRTGIELFGLEYTRDTLFPVIRAANVRVRPPERVALSMQLVRAYKGTTGGRRGGVQLVESPTYREMAHAAGCLTVYIQVPTDEAVTYRELLAAIGYWGPASSLAFCIEISSTAPPAGEFAVPLQSLAATRPIQQFFVGVTAEFRDPAVGWGEIMPEVHSEQTDAIRLDLYVWPMVIGERHRGGKLLLRRSL